MMPAIKGPGSRESVRPVDQDQQNSGVHQVKADKPRLGKFEKQIETVSKAISERLTEKAGTITVEAKAVKFLDSIDKNILTSLEKLEVAYANRKDSEEAIQNASDKITRNVDMIKRNKGAIAGHKIDLKKTPNKDTKTNLKKAINLLNSEIKKAKRENKTLNHKISQFETAQKRHEKKFNEVHKSLEKDIARLEKEIDTAIEKQEGRYHNFFHNLVAALKAALGFDEKNVELPGSAIRQETPAPEAKIPAAAPAAPPPTPKSAGASAEQATNSLPKERGINMSAVKAAGDALASKAKEEADAANAAKEKSETQAPPAPPAPPPVASNAPAAPPPIAPPPPPPAAAQSAAPTSAPTSATPTTSTSADNDVAARLEAIRAATAEEEEEGSSDIDADIFEESAAAAAEETRAPTTSTTERKKTTNKAKAVRSRIAAAKKAAKAGGGDLLESIRKGAKLKKATPPSEEISPEKVEGTRDPKDAMNAAMNRQKERLAAIAKAAEAAKAKAAEEDDDEEWE
jgi:hypothetical protein